MSRCGCLTVHCFTVHRFTCNCLADLLSALSSEPQLSPTSSFPLRQPKMKSRGFTSCLGSMLDVSVKSGALQLGKECVQIGSRRYFQALHLVQCSVAHADFQLQ